MAIVNSKNHYGSKLFIVLILAIISGFISVSALRGNYTAMIKLRSAVTVADEQNTDVEKALKDLRTHVYSHMNTNLSSGNASIKPPIQLKARYERLRSQEAERIKSYNASVTSEGERVCGGLYPAGGFNAVRVQCIQSYVAENAITESVVSDDLYKFDFISPAWSPDLAGISMVLSIGFFIVFFSSVAKIQIKKRYF